METVNKVAVDKSGTSFSELNAVVQATFNKNMELYGPKLFVVEINNPEEHDKPLFVKYLEGFPAEEKQHHNCRCCRQFIHRYGDLAFVNDEGDLVSALWDADAVSDEFKASIRLLQRAVTTSKKILHMFTEVPGETLGLGETNGWKHFVITHPDLEKVDEKLIGELRGMSIEKAEQITKAIADYPVSAIRTGLHLLEGDFLNMAKKYRRIAEWFLAFATIMEPIKNEKRRENLIAREAARVSKTHSHIPGNVLGRLLDDIKEEKYSTTTLIRRSNELTKPELYQRTVAAPSEGNVKVAVKIFTELGMDESDLERRSARLEEIETIWKPKADTAPVSEEPKKMFGSIVTKEAEAKPDDKLITSPVQHVTLRTFMEDVLRAGKALSMQLYVPTSTMLDVNFTTSVKPDAGRIFWFDDHEEKRNRCSWYTKNKPVDPRELNLTPGTWVNITALADIPATWGGNPRGEQYSTCAAILEGAHMKLDSTMCLFPELLHPELSEVGRVIETYSNNNKMRDQELGTTTGTPLGPKPHLVRVKTLTGISQYQITGYK